MVVGVRQVNDSDLPSQGWVNTHLQYTHGYAMVLAPSNQPTAAQPSFDISAGPACVHRRRAPDQAAQRLLRCSPTPTGATSTTSSATPASPRSTTTGASGNPATSTYNGTGGVQLKNFLVKAAFAIRFNDFNLLVSDLVTRHSRIMFVRDITPDGAEGGTVPEL